MPNDYLKARLRGAAFALPARDVERVLSDRPIAIVPFAPKGISGIIFFEGCAIPLLGEFGNGEENAKLQIVCLKGLKRVAYPADSVDGFVTLTDDEISSLSEGGYFLNDEVAVKSLDGGNEC